MMSADDKVQQSLESGQLNDKESTPFAAEARMLWAPCYCLSLHLSNVNLSRDHGWSFFEGRHWPRVDF
jgi:hypothetical protein